MVKKYQLVPPILPIYHQWLVKMQLIQTKQKRESQRFATW